jgi:hypothetical protein
MRVLLPGALSAAVGWQVVLRQPPEWYASPEARAIADTMLLFQP